MADLVFFPEAFIQLQREVCNHPALQARLQKHHDRDGELQFSKCIAEVCAYCNIVIDGLFTEQLLISLAYLCTQRLRSMGAEVIISSVMNNPKDFSPSSESGVGIIDVAGNPISKH